jgi:beta-glucosidase
MTRRKLLLTPAALAAQAAAQQAAALKPGTPAAGAARPASAIDRKVEDLLARMTLEEKLGQMSQTTFGRLDDQRKEEIRKGRWGSLFGGGTTAEKAEAQRLARESRLGIPLLFGADVIHGARTTFPIPLAQAATWDAGLVRQAARLAAREAAAEGLHWTFSPMVDIARDPRWGRIAEGFGEDPYLAGALGAAMVEGYQGGSLQAADSLAACAKHYVGYGAAEAGRDYNTTWIPENLLRDVYLKPFLAAHTAGVATYMSAFNAINGVPASANEFTLRRVLRGEWNFDGFVVSDYTAIQELIPHGFAANGKDAALKGIRAGVDMEMVSTHYFENGKALVDGRQLPIKTIDDAVRAILRVKVRLGLFGERAQPSAAPPAGLPPDALAHARSVAAQSLVLLKNDGILPLPLLKTTGKVAVIGWLADSPRDQLGTWAMGGTDGLITPLAALRQAIGESRVLWAPGLKSSSDTSRGGFAEALVAARGAETVVVFLGEEATLSGEASSRAYLDLPGLQQELFSEVAKSGKRIVAVILAGRPTTFHSIAARANAVLYAWHPGTMGGPAIIDVLTGNLGPSGRLPVTFPRTIGQVPIYYAQLPTGRPADPRNKFTSKYLDTDVTPEYPFGFGLTYSKIEYSNPRVSAPRMRPGGSLTFSADVTNKGDVEAAEVVQFYTRQLAASVARPVRQLRAYQRIVLKPGETRTVEFALASSDLAFYNARMQLVTEPGSFHAWIAPDAASGQLLEFQIA